MKLPIRRIDLNLLGGRTARLEAAEAERRARAEFEALVKLHQGAVYAYLRSRLLQSTDAEDLTQEVFLRAYLARSRFNGSREFKPWLMGIARNLLREHVRRLKRQKEVAWTELCMELDELASPEEEPRSEELSQLPSCMERLGPSAREALEFHYGSRMQLVDIGQRLRRSEGAVKLLLHRARQALKHCLESKAARTRDG